MRRPTEADGWPYGRLPWARGLRVARTARAHTRSVGGRAADNPRLVAHGQASSQGWRQNKLEKSRRACFAGSPAADYPACGIASITRLSPHSHRFFSLVKWFGYTYRFLLASAAAVCYGKSESSGKRELHRRQAAGRCRIQHSEQSSWNIPVGQVQGRHHSDDYHPSTGMRHGGYA